MAFWNVAVLLDITGFPIRFSNSSIISIVLRFVQLMKIPSISSIN